MILDDKWVHEVCRLGQGAECCRYLTLRGDGFACAKLHPPLALLIDERASKGTLKAMGDRCPGKEWPQ